MVSTLRHVERRCPMCSVDAKTDPNTLGSVQWIIDELTKGVVKTVGDSLSGMSCPGGSGGGGTWICASWPLRHSLSDYRTAATKSLDLGIPAKLNEVVCFLDGAVSYALRQTHWRRPDDGRR